MVERDTIYPHPQWPIRIPRGPSLEYAHELKRDRAILEIQENIRTLSGPSKWV